MKDVSEVIGKKQRYSQDEPVSSFSKPKAPKPKKGPIGDEVSMKPMIFAVIATVLSAAAFVMATILLKSQDASGSTSTVYYIGWFGVIIMVIIAVMLYIIAFTLMQEGVKCYKSTWRK